MVTASDKEKKRLAEKHGKLLAELAKQPDNATCTRWASWNLGVFLCIRCGGFHRHLGTHITKVKSISLDNWTTEQIEHFRSIGNKRANAYFNPHPEHHPPPRSDRDIERYIRDKYERRLFVDPRSGVPDPTVKGAAPAASAAPAVDEASALTRLREMGFMNVRDNHSALRKCRFDVQKAAALLAGGDSAKEISPDDPRVRQLQGMGFDHVGQNARALTLCNGDVTQAIELLLSDNPPPRAPVAAATGAASASASASAGAPPPPPPPKAAATAAPAPAKSPPASDLLGDDFFGPPVAASAAASAAAPSPAKPAASGNLNDLFGGLSLAAAPSQPQAQAQAQSQNDLFGDFMSATTATASMAPQQTVAAQPPRSAQPARNSQQGAVDTSFIMSLYGKSSAPTSPSAQPATGQQPAGGSSSNSGFAGLDFFMARYPVIRVDFRAAEYQRRLGIGVALDGASATVVSRMQVPGSKGDGPEFVPADASFGRVAGEPARQWLDRLLATEVRCRGVLASRDNAAGTR
ncbi:Gtpase activating protein [Coemansia javaensis]|uniref:Gtpase activating protein n=1 Tax=Coemansia javaensis TaxID=2761396 RepID=A0A9W8LKY4_9FUNG|nr:Gtpase activating protein [Coemansia javaensis]